MEIDGVLAKPTLREELHELRIKYICLTINYKRCRWHPLYLKN